jgi:hypothetical protein
MNPFDLPNALYVVVMGIVLLGWAALIVFPRRPWANFWFAGIAVPLTLCLFYMYLLLTFWYLPPQGRFADFFTLAGVHDMFANSGLLLVADQHHRDGPVVGAWMTRKPHRRTCRCTFSIPASS